MEHYKPSKEQVLEYLKRRREENYPAFDLREIRRQLGWELVEAQRKWRAR